MKVAAKGALSALFLIVFLVTGLLSAGQATATTEAAKDPCSNPYACIGMVIDSGDPVLIQMGKEMSKMVTGKEAGTVVKPTAGPIANVRRLLSKENAGLSVVPSDMLLYAARSKDKRLNLADSHLRFIMTIGKKVVHVVARKDIRSLKDLDGKRVVMGPDNTAIWVVSNNLLHIHGAKPSKRIQMKPPAGLKAVIADEADAVFVVGDAPHKLLLKLADKLKKEGAGSEPDRVHMLELTVPEKNTEYRPATVNYPGFAENVKTVAILPTLVSYNFTLKSTPYYKRRCGELAKIGDLVRGRLEQLRASGHKQWKATTWELEAGNWEKDPCFFGTAKTQLVAKAHAKSKTKTEAKSETVTASASTGLKRRSDVRAAQIMLNRLGYDVGAADGLLGPKTSAGIKRFQTDFGLKVNGAVNETARNFVPWHILLHQWEAFLEQDGKLAFDNVPLAD